MYILVQSKGVQCKINDSVQFYLYGIYRLFCIVRYRPYNNAVKASTSRQIIYQRIVIVVVLVL